MSDLFIACPDCAGPGSAGCRQCGHTGVVPYGPSRADVAAVAADYLAATGALGVIAGSVSSSESGQYFIDLARQTLKAIHERGGKGGGL